MTENAHEMIDALVDGERVDAEVLRRALADASGRDYLIDILALRDAVAQTSPKSQPDVAPQRPRPAWHRAVAWPAAAAVLVASLAAGFAAGYQFAGAPAERCRVNRREHSRGRPGHCAARIDCARADSRHSPRIGRRLAGRHGRQLSMWTPAHRRLAARGAAGPLATGDAASARNSQGAQQELRKNVESVIGGSRCAERRHPDARRARHPNRRARLRWKRARAVAALHVLRPRDRRPV